MWNDKTEEKKQIAFVCNFSLNTVNVVKITCMCPVVLFVKIKMGKKNAIDKRHYTLPPHPL